MTSTRQSFEVLVKHKLKRVLKYSPRKLDPPSKTGPYRYFHANITERDKRYQLVWQAVADVVWDYQQHDERLSQIVTDIINRHCSTATQKDKNLEKSI